MIRALAVLLTVCAPLPAKAGGWLQDKGQAFVSLSQEHNKIDQWRDTYTKLYAEYGLSKRITIGAQLSQSDTFQTREGAVFIRLPLGRKDGSNKFSSELSIGAFQNGDDKDRYIRSTLSWGRSFDRRLSGWMNIDVGAEQALGSGLSHYKADMTLGLNLRPRLKAVLQLQSGVLTGDDPYSRFTPSIAYEVRPGAHLELGWRRGLVNENSQGLKIGTWLKF